MEKLNFHHLLYFWTAAKHGSISRAAEELGLAQPTVSTQIQDLEKALGHRLFRRTGRKLVLTEFGQMVYSYADEIASLGRELVDVVRQRSTDRPLRLTAGVVDAVPKLIACELLRPVFGIGRSVHLVVREGTAERLVTELAAYRLDIILADEPVQSTPNLRVFNHPLGECGITFFAAPELARTLRHGFPRSLSGAPALLPTGNTALRRTLERWFATEHVTPRIIGEFEDSALVKTFGAEGFGFFAIQTVIADEIVGQYDIERVGELPEPTERFHAITLERRLIHPAANAIVQAARSRLFGGKAGTPPRA